MLNRQRDEILRDILAASAQNPEGTGISRIMFHAYLSHVQAKAYVMDLVDKGLLDNTSSELGRNFYKVTPKGLECLAALNHITEMLASDSMRRTKSVIEIS
jgi:predicted transcriptional regulator